MQPSKATAVLGHACGCSFRAILGHELERVFLADGYLVCVVILVFILHLCISVKICHTGNADFCSSDCLFLSFSRDVT